MSQAKATLRLRRRRKAGPTLGAAGLSLSLAGGASAATGAAIADTPVCSSVAVSHELTLAEEEITDVGLATFRIAEKESTLRFRTRIVAGGCGACGSGFYAQPTYNSQPTYNGPTNGPSPSAGKPTRPYVHTLPRQQVPKNQNQNASRTAQPKARRSGDESKSSSTKRARRERFNKSKREPTEATRSRWSDDRFFELILRRRTWLGVRAIRTSDNQRFVRLRLGNCFRA
jgi:hypothetical protein